MDADLHHMLRRLLRPLIAMLMRRGVGYIAMRDLLKRVYMEEALRQHPGEEPTDSTLSLVTGINRRDVKRLREDVTRPASPDPANGLAGVNLAARVVATWISAASFRNADGTPRLLDIHNGPLPDFDALLRAAKVDVRARTVIATLERAGVVAREEGKRLRLLRTAYTPDTPREKMQFLAANTGDHLRAALHNLEGGTPPFFERALFNNAVFATTLQALRPQLVAMADRLLREANEKLLAASHDDNPPPAPPAPRRRMRLGVYYYEADADDQP